MRTLSHKQKATVAGLTLLGLTGTGSLAYAYWTTTGSGSGSGTVAASNGTLTLHASFPTAGLHPGGSVVVSFTADNPGATDLQVGTISTVVSSPTAGCDASWFSVADVAANQVVPAGATGHALTATGSLVFANDAANQDACKGATINLALTS